MAKRSPAASTISAETIASVSGILMVKLEPSPGTDLTSMVPPIWSMLVRTTSMPTPRPDTLVTLAAVEKPGAKMNLWICASVIFSRSASVASPFSTRLLLDALGIEAAAVVGDPDDDVAAFVIGGETDGAASGLAGVGAVGRHLEAVIGRVAHHVGERILDQVEHLAVELGVGAVHLEVDLLAEFARRDRARCAAASARRCRSAACASS